MARTTSLTQQTCEEEARKVLSKHGVDSWPVRVDRIAKARGAKIRYSPLDDELSGMAFYKDQLPIIGVNSKHHTNRQRFTIAHEIGHFCLHDDILKKGMHVDKVITMLKRDTNSSAGTINIEVEANQFAAELLMPTSLMKAYLDQGSLDYSSTSDEDIVESMAKAFKVSPTAMAYRVAKVF
jgi:Zn-dependent peptidase ImmA (M78 family)